MAQHQEGKIGFKSVQLFKDQTLGIGSYGAVCKAKCDDLLCAAKILHPTLFDPTAQLQVSRKQEHRLPIKRFEQECEFLSTIRHPNIVQYLCMHQDPDTGLPVLLMELMDESLTHFLESSQQPIAYHIVVNICHDITLALSFLHSNGIIHRDLSSNNVLLRGNILAKVTDFGMAKLGDLNPQATRYTFTMCPGTDVYMPPEAVKDEPVYTEKIDCFSFGVIIVQTSTRQFPKPGNRWQEVEINHPGLPRGQVAVRVTEVDRRQNDISQVDPNHPLLPIALDCLKDGDTERPSAQQLCERVASLKERVEYSDSVAAAQQEGQQLRQELQQIQQLHREQTQQIVREKEREIVQLRRQLQQIQQLHREETDQLHRINQETLTGKERELGRMRQQMEIHEQERANLEKQLLEKDRQLHEPEGKLLLRSKDKNHQEAAGKVENIKLVWREGKKAPFTYKRFCDAVVDGSKVYFQGGNLQLFTYNINDSSWLQLPDCPFSCSSLAILNGQPTTIGGSPCTNKLMTLTNNVTWMEKFPPMPTKRKFVTVVSTGTVLIIAGGVRENYKILATVEVLNFETNRWSTTIGLPRYLYRCPASVHGDQLYMLGSGSVGDKSVYTCSVSALLQTFTQRSIEERTSSLSNSSSGVWSKLPDLPVMESTCVTFCGQLLAVGGEGSDNKPFTAGYNQATNSWNIISHMTTARRGCFAAVLPNNQLMVVGGQTKTDRKWTYLDSVEFGSLI
jgi:serine/threonine protein kinase